MKTTVLLFLLALGISAFAQVAVNTDGSLPDNSAMLDIKSPTKGFLPPRVELTAINQATPVTSPAVGLLVYNTATAGAVPNNVTPGNYYWSGSKWVPVTVPQGSDSGDMLYWNGTQWVRIPVGTNGQTLVLNSTVPTWGQPSPIPPIVTTYVPSNLSSSSATCGGNVSDGGSPVIARGVCWSVSIDPTVFNNLTNDGAGSGSFTSNITGLNPNTLYHVRAYAINSVDTAYGEDKTFTTINIVTTTPYSITATTATSGGTISSDGGNPITSRGVCWSTFANPTTADFKTLSGSGTGTFTSNLTGLTGNTTYFVRAYIINGSGTFYGDEKTFLTSPVGAIVYTADTSNVTKTTAQIGGTITNNGGSPVTARGVCWNTAPNPTIANSKTMDGSGSGSYTSIMTGLTQGINYYVRAYATNTAGTSYDANNKSFYTKGTSPTVTFDEVVGITTTTAIAVGNVTFAGIPTITERGFCWHTSPNPTINNKKLACGSGAGAFNGSLTILAPNTIYYVRAYATNVFGTFYSAPLTFTTQNAYYTGFESGMPAGWNGMWSVVTGNPFEGYYSLYSEHTNDTITFTRTVTTPSGGQVSFEYFSAVGGVYVCGCCPTYCNYYTQTKFYIDDVEQAAFSESSWSIHTFPITPGTHTFKWKNMGWNGGYNGAIWIDYFICTH